MIPILIILAALVVFGNAADDIGPKREPIKRDRHDH